MISCFSYDKVSFQFDKEREERGEKIAEYQSLKGLKDNIYIQINDIEGWKFIHISNMITLSKKLVSLE